MNTNSTDLTVNAPSGSDGTIACDSSPAHGGNATGLSGFAPSRSELYQLAKHWHRQLLGATFYSWAKGNLAADEPRLFLNLWKFGEERLDAIGSVLGTEVVNGKAYDEVRAELALCYGGAWNAFDDYLVEDVGRDANDTVLIDGFVLPPREALVDAGSLVEANAVSTPPTQAN
jgi:hypothetical protein